MNQDLLIVTKDLTRIFKKEKAVSQLSLQVRKNSIYGLLGPNGAGKTTTLKMLTGLIKPTSGEIMFEGHHWSRKDLSQIGSLIEQAPLYGNLSARENLQVHTTLLGLPRRRIDEVLQIVDLTQTSNKKAGHFSMGMKQRLGIAIALLNHPKLLILDEPTNGLDPIGIQELRELIKSFPSQGITVILSSHMLSEVEQVADDIGIMSHGVLGYQGMVSSEENLEKLFMSVVSKNRQKERLHS